MNCRVYRSVSDGFDSDHKIVVMTCDFPSMKLRREVFHMKEKSNNCNIKVLKHDATMVELYSKTLDSKLEDVVKCENVDELSDTITTALQKSSDLVIPKCVKKQDSKPCVDSTFLELIEARNNTKRTEERKKLNKEVNKYRDKIKNKYFEKKAIAINAAS